ncbi:uncharacterized protein LTR77_005837 [Saxophila tyrrhenica]|uniref:Protein kinase domain-containing protein n=1 Tax=Saxophila tyrrhenica TaxID=1690608 RepID=A0AAV9P9L1_9PEZI|nr:hypothetical protein LTR77_005837 [Saxophila tyrrhenica]
MLMLAKSFTRLSRTVFVRGTQLTSGVDIQPGNIMVRNPDESVLRAYLEKRFPDSYEPTASTSPSGIIRSQPLRDQCLWQQSPQHKAYLLHDHYFGHLLELDTLQVALADWGVASWGNKHLTEIIQPDRLRAPEVMLRVPWDKSVDFWKLACLMPELIFGQLMFTAGGMKYSLKFHLDEINALLGAFPSHMLAESPRPRVEDIFDGQGNVRESKLKRVVPLEQRFRNLTEGEGGKLVELIRGCLAIDRSDRPTAAEALEMRWLSHVYTQEARLRRGV